MPGSGLSFGQHFEVVFYPAENRKVIFIEMDDIHLFNRLKLFSSKKKRLNRCILSTRLTGFTRFLPVFILLIL